MSMDINSSIRLLENYANTINLSIADAITKLSGDIWNDYIYTLPGAPKGYQAVVSAELDQAVRVFSKYRIDWIKKARSLGVDLKGFQGLGVD